MTKNLLGNLKTVFTSFVGILIIFMVIVGVIYKLDHDVLLSFVRDISLQQMLVASLATICVFLLSTLRFAIINRKFGGNEDFLFLHRLNMLSMLYSQIAMPLIAQIIGRVSHGSPERSIYYAPITVLEKSIALSVMIIIGGYASFVLFNKNILPPGLLNALIFVIAGIGCVLFISINIFFTKEERQQFISSILKITKIGILPVIGLSILIQFGILITYTVIALQFVPDANVMLLIGGFAIVVLATTVPIGFSGWGVREASAAAVFFSLGMAPEIGLLVGLIYGTLNLIILISSVIILKDRTNLVSKNKTLLHNPFKGINFWHPVFFIFMTLLPFQLRMPLEDGMMTVNTADIFALMIMLNFILGQYLKGQLATIWTDRLMWIGLLGIMLIILIGWVVGWIYFGSNQWATANRLMGFITALSFLFTGAAMRFHLKQEMLIKLGFVLAFSFIFSALYKLAIFNIGGVNFSVIYNWKSSVQGFVGDRNAFSFLGALSAVFIAYNLNFSKLNNKSMKIAAILLPIIMIILIYSGSRSGLGAAIFIGIYTVVCLNRHILLILISSIVMVSVLHLINIFAGSGMEIIVLDGRKTLNLFELDPVRSGSYVSGIKLFFENPLFGGGLGSSMKQTGVVIHNLWYWIIGEMGLVGIFLCIPFAAAFVRTAWKKIYQPNTLLRKNAQLHGIVLFIIIFGGFSLFQDVAYQRILWLMLGFFMVQPFTAK